MNKEFEDWLDQQIAIQGANPTAITKAELAKIVHTALMNVSVAEDLFRERNEAAKIEDVLSQIKITYDEVIDKIRGCCGIEAGDRSCLGHGCGFLRRIAVQLHNCIGRQ